MAVDNDDTDDDGSDGVFKKEEERNDKTSIWKTKGKN